MSVGYSRVEDFFRLDAYQLILLVFHEFAIFTMLSNVVFNVFAASPPSLHACPADNFFFNGTDAQRCAAWNESDFCSDLQFEPLTFISVNAEFGIFCGQNEQTWLDHLINKIGLTDKAKFSTTTQMVGLVIAALYAGDCAGRFGRKQTLLVAFFSVGLFQVISSFVQSMDLFVFSRLLLGLSVGVTLTVVPVYVIECLPKNHRIWLCTVVTWAPNYIIFALFARFFPHWRVLARISAAATFCAFFTLLLLEESPKYLIQKKQRQQAVRSLLRINRFNSHKASLEETQRVVATECGDGDGQQLLEKKRKEKEKHYSFLDLYSTRKLAMVTVVGSYAQFALSTITYALMFNMRAMGGSVYVNMMWSGLLRWIVGTLVALLDHFARDAVGRKLMHFLTFGLVTLCVSFNLFAYLFLPLLIPYTRYFALVAFGATGCIFLQLSISFSELYPTGVRSLAAAHFNITGRMGNVVGPIVFSLSSEWAYSLLTLLALTEILLYMLVVPETKGIALPNDMPPKHKDKSNNQIEAVERLK